MKFSLDSLPELCLADPTLPLPEMDKFEIPNGRNYYAGTEVKVRKSPLAHASIQPHRLDRLGFPQLTKDESELDPILGCCAVIVETRPGYPIRAIEEAKRRLAEPHRYVPVRVRTVRANRMLAVVRKDAPDRFHYHAIFLSEANFKLAQPMLEGVDDVSSEWIDMNEMPQVRIRNAKFCCEHMAPGDLQALADAARRFATFARPFLGAPSTLEQSMLNIKRALDEEFHAEVMQRGSSVDEHYLYQLLGVAVARDYLPRNKAMLLAPYLPFPIVR